MKFHPAVDDFDTRHLRSRKVHTALRDQLGRGPAGAKESPEWYLYPISLFTSPLSEAAFDVVYGVRS